MINHFSRGKFKAYFKHCLSVRYFCSFVALLLGPVLVFALFREFFLRCFLVQPAERFGPAAVNLYERFQFMMHNRDRKSPVLFWQLRGRRWDGTSWGDNSWAAFVGEKHGAGVVLHITRQRYKLPLLHSCFVTVWKRQLKMLARLSNTCTRNDNCAFNIYTQTMQ